MLDSRNNLDARFPEGTILENHLLDSRNSLSIIFHERKRFAALPGIVLMSYLREASMFLRE